MGDLGPGRSDEAELPEVHEGDRKRSCTQELVELPGRRRPAHAGRSADQDRARQGCASRWFSWPVVLGLGGFLVARRGQHPACDLGGSACGRDDRVVEPTRLVPLPLRGDLVPSIRRAATRTHAHVVLIGRKGQPHKRQVERREQMPVGRHQLGIEHTRDHQRARTEPVVLFGHGSQPGRLQPVRVVISRRSRREHAELVDVHEGRGGFGRGEQLRRRPGRLRLADRRRPVEPEHAHARTLRQSRRAAQTNSVPRRLAGSIVAISVGFCPHCLATLLT